MEEPTSARNSQPLPRLSQGAYQRAKPRTAQAPVLGPIEIVVNVWVPIPAKLPIHCQSSDQEVIGGARMNPSQPGSWIVVNLLKQVQSGEGSKGQDVVLIT
jgi:hypothetical protein